MSFQIIFSKRLKSIVKKYESINDTEDSEVDFYDENYIIEDTSVEMSPVDLGIEEKENSNEIQNVVRKRMAKNKILLKKIEIKNYNFINDVEFINSKRMLNSNKEIKKLYNNKNNYNLIFDRLFNNKDKFLSLLR